MKLVTAFAFFTASTSAFTAVAPRGIAPKSGVAHFDT